MRTPPDTHHALPREGWAADLPFLVLSLILGVIALIFLSGCATRSFSDIVIGPGYQPANLNRAVDSLPPSLRRVAVLPLVAGGNDASFLAGLETLAPLLQEELTRTRAFELVQVSPEQLRLWTGRSEWTAEEKLPRDFFPRLNEELHCDAVLFARLTHYHPYQPIVVGWSFKLAAGQEPAIWWSVDEVFDAGDPKVVNAARRYCQAQIAQPGPLADSHAILSSPRRFGQYTLGAVLRTLPGREKEAKVSAVAADNLPRTK